MHRLRITLWIFLFVASGCTPLTEEARSVQVHSEVSTVLDGCKRLGPVTASISAVNMDGYNALRVRLREATARMGGDTVAILNTDTTLTHAYLHGVAFRCY